MGHGRSRITVGHSAGTGAGISLTAHALFGVLIWTGVATSGRVSGVDVGSGETGVVSVGLMEDAPPPVAPPPPSLTATKLTRLRRAVVAGTASHKVTPTTVKPTGKELTSLASAPPIEAIKSTSETHVATPALLASARLAPPPIDGAATAGPSEPGAPAEAVPASRAPAYVEPEVTTYLRSQDYFPSLPSSLRARGAHYQARLDICVSREGRVVDVGFRQPAAPALDSVLATAVRGWRYRPLMVNGAPAPFCHRMTVSYTM
jgi:hypothetical protein